MATKDENDTTSTTPKTPSGKTTSTRSAAKTSSEDVPREELRGVIRTSRVGSIGFNGATSGSTPDELADRRHERLEEAKKPGDDGYNAFTDPMVPSSSLAQIIMTELAAEDNDGSSPTWDALNEAYQGEHEERMALREFREKRRAS